MASWALRRQREGYFEWRVHQGPRDALDELPLYIILAERDALGPATLVKRRLQFYSLCCVKEGDCWYWSEHRPRAFRVEVGQAILTAPGVLHAYGGQGAPFHEDYAAFIGPVADRLHALGVFDCRRPVVNLPDPQRIGEIADIVHAASSSVEEQLWAGLILQRLLFDTRRPTGDTGPPGAAAVDRLLKRLAEAPQQHLSNPQMAAFCGMSESHFRKVFREKVGTPPNHYCERMRMGHACRLLSRSNQRVHQVAKELGYDDPLYFSKRFSAVIGLSPRAYRKSMRD